ncbi:hypothetical protein [Kitasatospora purpeofusca]|uniref:hypothetical protein n=1 Tax=Kitasatospora purpeofusca TaxID=67352 RepID=UPI0012FED2C4|nr:hypothetical protein [Kitasatospora purpeofusca]
MIRSWRTRAALMWLAHHPDVRPLPLLAAGVIATTGRLVPDWLGVSALPLTAVLFSAGWVGGRLHDELDEAGIPCRWCEDNHDLVTEY